MNHVYKKVLEISREIALKNEEIEILRSEAIKAKHHIVGIALIDKIVDIKFEIEKKGIELQKAILEYSRYESNRNRRRQNLLDDMVNKNERIIL